MTSGPLHALAFIVAGVLAAVPAHAELDREALVRVGSSVVKIEARRQQGGYSLGSGVVVAADRVVTNCHVTRDATDLFVLHGDVRLRVQAQASDIEHDLCMLRVSGIDARSVPLGSSSGLKARQGVTAVGYTGGLGIQSSAGIVVALHRMEGAQVIQSTNWFTSGASGGGLFDDDMRLVGVLTFRLRGGEDHYFAAPVEWLQPLLSDQADFRPVAPAAALPMPYWQRAPAQQPRFLQAIAMVRDANWPALETLASTWVQDDAADPESWYHLALVLARQGALERSRQARARLQGLDPERALALDAALARS